MFISYNIPLHNVLQNDLAYQFFYPEIFCIIEKLQNNIMK